VEEVRAGSFLGAPSEAQVLADFSRPGEVVIGASRLGKVDGVHGTGVLAHITFRALAKGTAEVGFSASRAMDSTLEEVGPVAVESTAVEVRKDPGPIDRPDRPRPPHES